MMDMEVKNKPWEKIFSVIQRSYTIDKHMDFFIWLQSSVIEIVPHDMLLASWGDFEKRDKQSKLNYDVASNISNVSTKVIFAASAEIDDFMLYLHQGWLINNRRWFTLNNLNQLDFDHEFNANFLSKLNQLNSLLVYGVSDVRGNNECLYVFFSKQNVFEVQDSVMGLIMPHIDNVLRKIQHLQPVTSADESVATTPCFGLTARELEIIHWIKSGKTNQEIGMILQISQNTVKSHLKRIFSKLNVSRRAQAVAMLSNQ
ncbi:MAG TPA: XrtB/PEP-CTERM-associated transcriptional regulator EpsA [Methylotenera sp.]|nr:XrtB/PEP-CTERM-associated transcriptional regulator EpsA [Methylotenera sp.]